MVYARSIIKLGFYLSSVLSSEILRQAEDVDEKGRRQTDAEVQRAYTAQYAHIHTPAIPSWFGTGGLRGFIGREEDAFLVRIACYRGFEGFWERVINHVSESRAWSFGAFGGGG
jgi:hypothetical protein